MRQLIFEQIEIRKSRVLTYELNAVAILPQPISFFLTSGCDHKITGALAQQRDYRILPLLEPICTLFVFVCQGFNVQQIPAIIMSLKYLLVNVEFKMRSLTIHRREKEPKRCSTTNSSGSLWKYANNYQYNLFIERDSNKFGLL